MKYDSLMTIAKCEDINKDATCILSLLCQQGTLTLPDTWFRPPLWDLLVFQWSRPDSSNLPCLYSTFHLESKESWCFLDFALFTKHWVSTNTLVQFYIKFQNCISAPKWLWYHKVSECKPSSFMYSNHSMSLLYLNNYSEFVIILHL